MRFSPASLSLLALASLSPLARAGDSEVEYFVSPSGDDDASGESPDSALRSLTEALARLRELGGGNAFVMPGSYSRDTETFPLDPPPRARIRAYIPEEKPSIGGTFSGPVFWVRDVPRSVPEDSLEEIPWPLPDPDAVVLSGLRITDGGLCAGGDGGALRVTRASVLLEDCELVENHAGINGGGIFIEEGSKVIARRSEISRNYPCGGITPQGVGVFSKGGSVFACEDCVLADNRTYAGRGTAGILADSTQVLLRNCRVLNNFGKPLDLGIRSRVVLESCVIAGHTDGIRILSSSLVMTGTLVYGNGPARAMVIGNSTTTIDRCVVAYNNMRIGRPREGGEAFFAGNSSEEIDAYPVRISNSIFWANNDIGARLAPPPRFPYPHRPTVLFPFGEIRHSIVQRGTPPFDDYPIGFNVHYVNVLDADPLFVNPLRGDFRLRPGSPAIDAGDPESPPDTDGTRRDIGVHFDDLVPHPIFIRADANGDSWVDVSDAVRILMALFVDADLLTCADAADYDDSGTVDISDAIAILGRIFRQPMPMPPPTPPFPIWGVDWTPDDPLGCDWLRP